MRFSARFRKFSELEKRNLWTLHNRFEPFRRNLNRFHLPTPSTRLGLVEATTGRYPWFLAIAKADGRAFIFSRNPDRSFGPRAAVELHSPSPKEIYGFGVDVRNDTVVIGSMNDRSALIYEKRKDGTWPTAPSHVLLPNNTNDKSFGQCALIGDGVIVIGAQERLSVFVRFQNGSWPKRASYRLARPKALDFGDRFQVEVGGKTILASVYASSTAMLWAPLADGSYNTTHPTIQWTEKQNLFGLAIGISGDTAMIGGDNPNAARIYVRKNGAWPAAASVVLDKIRKT